MSILIILETFIVNMSHLQTFMPILIEDGFERDSNRRVFILGKLYLSLGNNGKVSVMTA